jgi:hypothetical protein
MHAYVTYNLFDTKIFIDENRQNPVAYKVNKITVLLLMSTGDPVLCGCPFLSVFHSPSMSVKVSSVSHKPVEN